MNDDYDFNQVAAVSQDTIGFVPRGRADTCCICAQRGYLRPVERFPIQNEEGRVVGSTTTALCARHAAYERELRAFLKREAKTLGNAWNGDAAKAARGRFLASWQAEHSRVQDGRDT